MASPDIPWEQRPWRQQRGLGEDDFKQECRAWDVNELVFSAALWGTYQVDGWAAGWVGGWLGGWLDGCGQLGAAGAPAGTLPAASRGGRHELCQLLPLIRDCWFTPLLAHLASLHLIFPCPCSVQPLMRADFTLFDEYEHRHAGAEPFDFPLTAFWGSRDRRIKQGMVQVRGRRRVLWRAAGQNLQRERAEEQASKLPLLVASICLTCPALLYCRGGEGSPPAPSSCTRWRGTICGRWRRAARRPGCRSSQTSWRS